MQNVQDSGAGTRCNRPSACANSQRFLQILVQAYLARQGELRRAPGRSGCWLMQCWIMGMANDAVLPEPVSAHPRMSRPDKLTGMPCAWMGVGRSYPWCAMSFRMSEWRFCGRGCSGNASNLEAHDALDAVMLSSRWCLLAFE